MALDTGAERDTRYNPSCDQGNGRNTYVGSTQPAPHRQTSSCELLDGDLVMIAAPNLKHQKVQRRLGQRLSLFINEHDLGKFFLRPCHVVLSDTDVVQPDLLFVSRAREHLLGGGENVRGAPDPVIEILFPTTRGPRPGLEAGAVRQMRGDRGLASRPDSRNRLDPSPTRRRAQGYAHVQPRTEASLALLTGLELRLDDVFSS